MPINVAVIGAGSWGTTVAALAAVNAPTICGRDVPSWPRRSTTPTSTATTWPSFVLPEQLRATSSLEDAVSHADVLVMAVPSHGYRDVAAEAAPYLRPWVPIVSLTKGIERSSRKRMSEVTSDEMPGHPVAVLTGPNLAKEILGGQPAASVVAIDDEVIAAELQRIFSRPSLRIYTNPDVVGCEVGGVVKNVIAIAAGMAGGHGLRRQHSGDADHAWAGGDDPARHGDGRAGDRRSPGSPASATSSRRARRRRAATTWSGTSSVRASAIDEVLGAMNMVAEGVKSSPSVLDLARRHGVEMPITEQVVAVCHHGTQRGRGARLVDATQPQERARLRPGTTAVTSTGVVGRTVAGDGHAHGVPSNRGTARRRSTGSSPPTTVGTTAAARRRRRQTLLEGTPVVETRVRIPGGDAVQRVYSSPMPAD